MTDITKPTESQDRPRKKYRKISRPEMFRLYDIARANGSYSDVAKIFSWNPGWSDQRLYDEVIKDGMVELRSVTLCRREAVGITHEEWKRTDDAKAKPILETETTRMDRLERNIKSLMDRVSALAAEVATIKAKVSN
jgi:beta-mannanase